MNMNKKNFRKLVLDIAAEIIESFPADLRENSADLIFTVSDKPSKEDVDEDSDYDDTLGLYDGIPINERSVSSADITPSRITLFRIPLIEMSNNIKELRKEIRLTIMHELGHHFGFDENDLEERGLG
jgi:predicted Zn-dependent protease with MMP-like domain